MFNGSRRSRLIRRRMGDSQRRNRTSARYWLGTIYPESETRATPEFFAGLIGKDSLVFLSGQLERCPTTGKFIFMLGRNHYQLLAGFSSQQRLAAVKRVVGNGHWEPTRSASARSYVHKELTAVPDTRFEFGHYPMRRNASTDWDSVRNSAKSGDLDSLPADIYIR